MSHFVRLNQLWGAGNVWQQVQFSQHLPDCRVFTVSLESLCLPMVSQQSRLWWASPQCPPDHSGAPPPPPAPSPCRQQFVFLLPKHNIQVSPSVTLIHAQISQPLAGWPHVTYPADLWALPSPACPTPGCVCASRLPGKQDVATWCSASLSVCEWNNFIMAILPLCHLIILFP